MSPKFECFVEICDQKYKLDFNENELNLRINSFEDIYHKIQRIGTTVLNEDIDLRTHEFKLFENYGTKGSVLRVLNEFIGNNSLIRVNCKPKEQICVLLVNHTISPLLSQTEDIPQQALIRLSDPTSDALTKSQSNPQNEATKPNTKTDRKVSPQYNYRRYYCNLCPILVDEESELMLFGRRFFPKEKKFNEYSKLLITIADISGNKYSNITEDHWSQDIPRHMRAFNAEKKPKWRKKFKLLIGHYINVLKQSPNAVIACNIFPFFHQLESITFDSNEDLFKEINALREEKSRSPSDLKSDEQMFVKYLIKKLIKCEEDIKQFHSIVMAIDFGYDLKYNGRDNPFWGQICYKLKAGGYSLTPIKCRENFFCWVHFYAENFNQLNGKLEQKPQKIFDLLKIIHIINLSKVLNEKNLLSKQITHIYETPELKHYFDTNLADIRFEKCVEVLTKRENDIKAFHFMVVNIGNASNYTNKKVRKDLFNKLSEELVTKGFRSYTSGKNDNQFKNWTEFYAQNYDLLNGKLNENLQKVFDLLKVIHILDLNKKMCQNATVYNKIKEISLRPDLKQYCDQYLKDI